jgi:hypothetical protein
VCSPGHADQDSSTRSPDILTGCGRVLAPNGRLVITARAYRRHGKLIDLPGQLITTAADAGLRLHARHIALLCGLRDEGFVPRVSFFQLHNHRAGMFPRTLPIAHEDVLVFRALTPKTHDPLGSRQPRTVPAQIDLSFRGDRGKTLTLNVSNQIPRADRAIAPSVSTKLTREQLVQLAPLIRDAMKDKSYRLTPIGMQVTAYLRAKQKRLSDESYRDYESGSTSSPATSQTYEPKTSSHPPAQNVSKSS